MYNKKVIIDAIKNLNKAKTFPKYNNAYTNNKPNKKNSNNITSEQGVNTPVFKSVHAAPSKIHGKGLFTQEPISKGDTIGVSHIRKKFMKNNEEYQAPFPSKQLGYYNHSESPNVYEVDNGDHIIMKAKRNINPGEELTANYYNANIKDLENPDNFKKGGATNRPKLPNKKNSKAYSRSFEATNRLFAQNPLFSKPKSRKNKIFDPNAKYYANGGALSKFLDGGPQCPEGYTYNPETKRCTRKNTNCPEGYFFDAQEGRCKSKTYREKFELYNKDTKITPTEEEESYSYWPDDLTLKDLDKGIMISPEGFENDRPFLINPIKTIGIYNPEKYEEDIDDRYLADTYVDVYPDLNYQVVVDPSKPKGYNADKSIYYVPDENNFEFEKFKQYKKLKEIEKENLSNLAKYPNLITKEWQEDYKYRPQDDPKQFLDAEYYGQGLPGYYTNLTDVPFDKYKNSIKRKFNTGCKDCKYHYGTSHEYNDDYNINLTNLGHVKKDFKSKDPSYYIRNIKEHDYVDLPDESMIPRFDLESADTPIYREGDPSMLVPHMRLEPGKTKSKKNRGRLIHGKGQKYKHTTYRQTKDLEFGTHKTNRPIPALVQKFTGYDPKYYQGYYKEVGDETEFVPGEIERAEQEGRKVNFKGAATLRDLIKQKKYDKQWKQKDEVRQRNEDYLKEYNITPEEYEQYYGPFRRGGQLPKAQYGLTGLGKDRGVTASPFDFRTPYGQSNDFFKNPNYSLTYTTPNLFKKIDMAANPLSFTIGRPYYTDAQRLTHPSLDTDAIYTQDYFGSSWQGQFGPEYEQYLQDVSDYSGVPVSGLNQTILNKYNAAQNLAAVKPTYKKGIPLTANVEYSLLGSAFGDKSTGPFSGALTFGAGYAPEPGFYGSVDASAYGVFGKRKNNQKIRPNHYFNKGLTRQGDRAWIPRLNIFNTVVRQRPEYNDAQTQKILELYKEDIERGTTTAEDFMADNEDQSSYNRYNISALSPELTFQVKPFKKIPGILSLTAGLRNTLGGKDKSETTVGGQWTSRPYGNIRYSVPVEGAIDRLKDLDLPPIKKRKSYYDYVNENEQTDDNNKPPTDNTFPPEDTSTDENTMQPSYDGEGVGKGPCPKGYERLCEKCRCTKIKTPRSPLLDKRGIHPYIDGKYLEDGGITVDLTPEEIEQYAKGGYIVEDISVPTLTRMDNGGYKGEVLKRKRKRKKQETEPVEPLNILQPGEELFPLPTSEERELYYEPISLKEMSPEELEVYKAEEQERLKYESDKAAQPGYFDEAMQWVKDWHNSPMYNQMVLKSNSGQQKKADDLTKLRKKNIETIPPLYVAEKSPDSPAARSNHDTGEIEIFPGGFNDGPSTFVHEILHSSDRPRDLYRWDHPAYKTGLPIDYFNKKGIDLGRWVTELENDNVVDVPDWMLYEDPRFDDASVWHNRVMPKKDQMYITTHRGSNWKDNERYKKENAEGLYTIKTDKDIENELSDWKNDPNYEKIFKATKELPYETIEGRKKYWENEAHNYISVPTEVRARLGEIRYNAQKEGIYDPFTQQITPEIFQNYINKERDIHNIQPMIPIDDLREEYTDEEILWMLQNISKNKSQKDESNIVQYGKKGGYIIEDISVPTLTRMQDGGLPKAFEGRPVKIKEKEKEKEKESEKINTVNTNIENLGTDYRPNVTSEKTSFNLGNFIKPLYDISKIKTDISKALAKSSTTQFLNATRPMEMALIKDLKNQGLISETLPEEILTTYPNLLDLATRRGIQKANTVFRGTRPFIGNSNILRSSENTQTELPLEYSNYLKSLPSDVARAAYMSSHISPINVGARVGLDHVIGMTTPMDALYYSRQNVDNPSMEYTYGPLQTELRFPFDFSEGNASTWLQKYREMPFRWKKQEDGSIEKNREYEPGVIHNIDIFTGGKPGNEGAILGLRNQRVLEPVRVRYNETFKNLEDQESLNNYLYEIMSKRSPEEQSDYITNFNNEILPQLDVPKDYLKDRGFTNFGPAESLYDAHNYLYHHNRYLKDIAKKPSNIQVIPYSPFSFKFKEGGQFELGDEVELTKEQLKKLQEEGYTFEIVK